MAFMEHGGRIQAQGGNTEESESWDQGTPLLAITAYEYLENLKIKIGRREADLRMLGSTKPLVTSTECTPGEGPTLLRRSSEKAIRPWWLRIAFSDDWRTRVGP